MSQSLKCVFCSRNAKCCGESCCIRMLCVVLLDTSTPMAPPKKTNDFASSDPHQWDLAVGYRWGGSWKTLEAPGDFVGHGGFSKHLGIWLSCIGGAGQGGL